MGTKSNQFLLDDYIYAAMSIYIDVVYLFMELLRLLSALTSNN